MNVLLVDTNFSSIPIYESLISWGCRVYLIGRNPNDFMAKNFPNYIEADYSDLDLLKNIIEEYQIQYIVPGCNDHSYQVCASLSKEKYAVNIDDLEKTNRLLNKKQFRDFCSKNKLPAPKSYTFDEICSAGLKKQIIVKPVDAFSGKGVTRLSGLDIEALNHAVQYAKKSSKDGSCVIEEFIEGQLYSHTAFIVDGVIVKDFVVEEYGSVNPFVVDTSFVKETFSELPLNDIRENIENIANILELSDGLIHTQLIVSQGRYWLVEITRRCPGDLYSQLIELSTGFNYAQMYASFFIGKKLPLNNKIEKNKSIIRHTITQHRDGIFNYVHCKEFLKLERYISIATNGDHLSPSPNGRIGILFVDAET
ncbi:MAG: ATP-grasp domain-containing protein, partial [Campylobacterales bacterium]|nr:ATP-grasp domain-containing protein [Campylobacterales bacterium]